MGNRRQSPLRAVVRATTEDAAFEATAAFVAERLESSVVILTHDSEEGLHRRASAAATGTAGPPTAPPDDAPPHHAVRTDAPAVLTAPRRGRRASVAPDASSLVVPFGECHVLVATPPADGAFDDAQRTVASLAVEFLTATREVREGTDLARRVESVLGHDVKSPLTVAHGELELARETGDTERLDAVSTALDRIEELADGLVHVARTGRHRAEHEEVDLRRAAARAWTVVDGGRAALVVEATTAVVADPNRLGQLLENCFRNAVEHGGPDVTITVGPTPTGFFVEDDGVGIPEAARGTVLARGYTTAADHDGLGLAVVTTIAEEHGWRVGIETGAAGGARIVVTTDAR